MAVADSRNADVNKPSKAYTEMADRWQLIDDLLGGTRAMRAAGVRWLPQEVAENDQLYSSRMGRSYLYGALRDATEKFTAKPFSKKIELLGAEKLSPELAAIETNADMLGSSLTDFARMMFRDGLQHGLSFLFVDYSQTATVGENGDVETPRKGPEKDMKARPYFQHFHSSCVIGAKPRVEPNGAIVPTQVRVRETRIESDGEFGEKERKYVRVYSEEEYVEWRQGDDGSWTRGIYTPNLLGGIPIVPFYVTYEGFFQACPPFEDLAWMNLSHWQSSSDQNNILHVARVPILHWSGISVEEQEKPVAIGPSRVIKSQSTGSKLEYVEHTGAAIGAGQKDLESLEARMEVLGLSPAMERVADQTAEARRIDDTNARSSIQSWIRGLETVLERGYEIAAKMLKTELPKDFAVDIFQDFGVGQRAQQDIEALQAARARGDIDQKTFLEELKRRGTLDESRNVDAIIEATDNEGPNLGEMNLPNPPPVIPPSTPPPVAEKPQAPPIAA